MKTHLKPALNEDEISALALQAGMRPADIILLLDIIKRWRSLGLERLADDTIGMLANHQVGGAS